METTKVTKKLFTVAKNGQISIGSEYAGRTMEMETLEDGRIVLSPGRFVPDHHAPFFTPEAKDDLKKFEEWARDHPPKETSTDDLKSLRRRRKTAVG